MERLDIRLKIRGPVLTAGVGTRKIGIDVNQLKNGADRPIISGTHIKGRLKFSILQMLLSHDNFIYGIPSVNVEEKDKIVKFWGSQLEPIFGAPDKYPSPVTVEDFILQDETPFSISHRIAILRDTGTVREGALAFIEGANSGQELTWKGSVLIPKNGTGGLHFEELKDLIIYGFLWLDSIGRQNNIGWGNIIGREIAKPSIPFENIVNKVKNISNTLKRSSESYMPININENEIDSIGIAIKLKSPLLVSDHSTKTNFFEGRDDIPGSVLKRAMADCLLAELGKLPGGWIKEDLINVPDENEYDELIKNFSSIFIRFAFPVNPCNLRDAQLKTVETKRPVPLPLTTFVYKGWKPEHGGPWDILIMDLKDDKRFLTHITGKRIIFKSDAGLKGWQIGGSGELFTPQHFIHTKTAIDNFTLASEEAKLFSYRAMSEVYNEAHQTLVSEIIFPKSEKQRQQILKILSKIISIGKSSRHGLGQIEINEIKLVRDNWQERLNQFNSQINDKKFLIPIMLTTETVLLEPFKVQLNSDLKEMYEKAWKTIFGDKAGLRKFYVHHKIRGVRKGKGGVPPVVLTDAGSVFVLEIDKDEQKNKNIETVLEKISTFGVEIDDYLETIDTKWDAFCPYRRTNGYGEVVICHPIHLGGVPHGKG